MTVATLTWPAVVVYVSVIATAGLLAAVLIWSIFRTGQTAIRSESGHRELVESLRREVEELRTQARESSSPAEPGASRSA